jgi:hypothetical protein
MLRPTRQPRRGVLCLQAVANLTRLKSGRGGCATASISDFAEPVELLFLPGTYADSCTCAPLLTSLRAPCAPLLTSLVPF